MHMGQDSNEAPVRSRSAAMGSMGAHAQVRSCTGAMICMRPQCAHTQGPCFQKSPSALTRRVLGFE